MGHASTHVFRKTSLQYAHRGEETSRRVAKDAGLNQSVLMTHYVEEMDPELRDASNRTFERILASLPTEVARRYGYVDQPHSDLEKRLHVALENRNWPQVSELASQLASPDFNSAV
jgi:hypothetical protein